MSKLAEIREVDYRKPLSDADYVALNDFENVLKREARPDDPPTPLERTIAQVTNLPDFLVFNEFWIQDEDGAIAGMAMSQWTDTDENRHRAWCDVTVLAPYRRAGLGRRLLGAILEVVDADSRTLIAGSTTDRIPAGETFARLIGAEVGMHAHTNRLLIGQVDRRMVDGWLRDGPMRAPGYSLVAVDGRVPDDIVQNAVDAIDVMNTAPNDDLDVEDFKLTVEQLREIEQMYAAEGTERWFVFARDDATARFVGLTEMFWNPAMPNTVQQGDTGVHPEHLGHALGKWLKAATLERVMRERPQVVDIRTGNADSNDAMLGINRELGFAPYIAHINWQVSVEKVREYVASR